MENLLKHLSEVCVPSHRALVYKDECMYSYDNPESPTGLYVSLTTFMGFGEDHVQRYAEMSGNHVFLHIYREKHLKEDEQKCDDEAGPDRKITRLAIGVEGGYNDNDTKNYEYTDHYSIVVMPDINTKIPFPSKDMPSMVTSSVKNLLTLDSALSKLEKKTLAGTWDGEIRQVSKFSEKLLQLNNGKKIPPSGWKCEKCDLTTNLWLNLTDGSILCGRKFFDGSGGNDHAVEHYREIGFPLAVKLGTITAEGKADVFSYAEDDMVIDSKLEEHLTHFGINMAAMKKSEKSMVELELEINQRIGEWSLLTESESELKPLAGPGLTGMRNLGNTCYINSVMQVLFTIPDFINRYVGKSAELYFNKYPANIAKDFDIQMAKLGNGLWSGKYSRITKNSLDSTGISPAMFKNAICKDHVDFGTKQQQDAHDFLLYFLNLLEQHSRNQPNPVDAIAFGIEDRVECMTSKRVKYTLRYEICLPLSIPLEKATNLAEVKEYLEKTANCSIASKTDKEIVRHKVPFEACLERCFGDEIVEQFYSMATRGIAKAKKSSRIVNMPDYLIMHVRKFTLGEDWVPKKLDVEIPMPDELDLSKWRAKGKQPGEEELPDPSICKEFIIDEGLLGALLETGYPLEACKRAIYHTKNLGVEPASSWLMQHIEDPDFSDPFVVPDTNDSPGDDAQFVADPESLSLLMSMGFDEHQATKALKATDGNIERATDWIFSHADEIDTTEAATTDEDPLTRFKKNFRDGSGKYKLSAFISHMGTSAQVGHYVCHIKKDDKWVIFNDSKVALSQNPPKNLGYLYLYKRED